MSSECKKCKETGCCQNCTNYRGGIEFIPTRISVTCTARKSDSVVLPYNAYPVINGETDKNCIHWERRKYGRKMSKR